MRKRRRQRNLRMQLWIMINLFMRALPPMDRRGPIGV